MTAFARSGAKAGPWAVEIRSLNHRYFEFSVKLPPALSTLEGRIRERVQAGLRRGKITVSIAQEARNGRQRGMALDEEAIRFYLAGVRKLKKRFRLQGEFSVSDILKLPGIFTGEEAELDAEKSWAGVKKSLDEALRLAVKAKETEGRELAKDIRSRLARIAEAVGRIERHAKAEPERIFRRLSERVAALAGDKEKDPQRFEREVAFLAERSDITEEIVRMRSHLRLFEAKLESSGEVGRELDFICQEMNREINTMSSKSELFEISTDVVFVKGELEKIREQIQNVE